MIAHRVQRLGQTRIRWLAHTVFFRDQIVDESIAVFEHSNAAGLDVLGEQLGDAFEFASGNVIRRFIMKSITLSCIYLNMTAMPAFIPRSAPTQWARETSAGAENKSPDICLMTNGAIIFNKNRNLMSVKVKVEDVM